MPGILTNENLEHHSECMRKLPQSNGSQPWNASRHRLGAYLILTTMVGLGLSSGLWLTAMAAQPLGVALGVALAAEHGVAITFASWLLASSWAIHHFLSFSTILS